MGDHIDAWQCIGVCQDRKVQLVPLDDHIVALVEIQRACVELQNMRAILLQLALSTPRPGQWESSYRTLQVQARRALAMPASDAGA